MKEQERRLLLIFTRNPELGKCKTRLAAFTGDKVALEIYKFLLMHTKNFTEEVVSVKRVYYSEAIWESDIWNSNSFEKKLQEGEDLGQRMDRAYRDGFADGFEKILIIGSDMFDLNAEDIENAFRQLDGHDYVIGPAEDGGYYLLGAKTYNPKLFQNKNWGTETVLRDTLHDLDDENFKILDTRNDVDTYEDIEHIEAFQPFLKTIKLKHDS